MNADVYDVGVQHLKALRSEGLTIVVLTARGQTCRPYTMAKLKAHGLWGLVDHIHHRPKKWEGVSSSKYKAAMIRRLSRQFEFVVSMEDENPNIDVMLKAGIPKVLDAKTWHGPAI